MEIMEKMNHIQRGEFEPMSRIGGNRASKTQTALSQVQTAGSSSTGWTTGNDVVQFHVSDFADNSVRILKAGDDPEKNFDWRTANDSVIVNSVKWTANLADGSVSRVLADEQVANGGMAARDDKGLILHADQNGAQLSLTSFMDQYGTGDVNKYAGDILALQVGWEVTDTNRSGYSQTPIFTVVRAPNSNVNEAFMPSTILTTNQTNGFDNVTAGSNDGDPSSGFKTGTDGGGGGEGPDTPSTPGQGTPSGGDSGTGGGGRGLSTGAIAGIAVGGGVALLLGLAAIIFLLCRRRRRQRQQKTMDADAAAYKNNTIMEDKHMHTHTAVATNSPYSDDEGAAMAARSTEFGYHHHEPAVPPATAVAGHHIGQAYSPDEGYGGDGDGDDHAVTQRQIPDADGRQSGSRSETPQGGVSHAVAHLVEEGMTEDEIRRLEEEERQLDAEIARAGGGSGSGSGSTRR